MLDDLTEPLPEEQDGHDEPLRREAVRVYERYATEVVEAFQLCPWARRARQDGRVRTCVVTHVRPRVQALLDQMDQIFADPRIEVGLLLLPRAPWERNDFRRFVSRVRAAHEARHAASGQPGPPPLAMAAFHPDAQPDLVSAARLVSFLRRTPDPTIQIVRQAVLASVRGTETSGAVYAPRAVLDLTTLAFERTLPLADRVAEANLATVTRVGVAHLEAILDDIRADRDRAYAALSEPGAPASRGSRE
jgi:hypothetical protein